MVGLTVAFATIVVKLPKPPHVDPLSEAVARSTRTCAIPDSGSVPESQSMLTALRLEGPLA